MKGITLFCFVLCILGFSFAKTVQDIFVDPNGKDNATCGAQITPCATLGYVLSTDLKNFSENEVDIQVHLVGSVHNLTTVGSFNSKAFNSTLTISPFNITMATVQVVQNDVTFLLTGTVSVTFKSVQFSGLASPIQALTKVLFEDCIFNNNQVVLAVGSKGDVTFSNVAVTNSVGNNTLKSTVTVLTGGAFTTISSKFDNNKNENQHIVDAQQGSIVYLSTTYFTNNVVGNSTGIILASSPNFHVISCSFSNNQAGDGGALYLSSLVKDGQIQNTNFTSNTASGNGGAVVVNGATVLIQDCLFQSNKANSNGGGIYVMNGDSTQSGTFSLLRSNFSSNSHGSNQQGSDIWMRADSVPSITNVTVSNNGDAIFCQSSSHFNSTTNTTVPGKTTNNYCSATCRAPQCNLCKGLCLLDNQNSVDSTGSGDCFSTDSISCNSHGACRLYHPSGKDHSEAQCECDATWAAPSCSSRSWLFYVLIALSIAVAAIVVGGGIFTIQNRVRNSRSNGYSTLN